MITKPRRIGEHTLDALKNWKINEKCLDYRAKQDASWPDDLIAYEGMVCHQTSTGTLLPGVGNTKVMPLFLRNNEYDADVNNYGGDPSVDKGAFVPAGPTGVFNTLVATGGYELLSTEIDTDNLGDYVRNAPLTSPTSGGTVGKLVVGVHPTNTIVGIVSRGIQLNPQRKAEACAFWTWLSWPVS